METFVLPIASAATRGTDGTYTGGEIVRLPPGNERNEYGYELRVVLPTGATKATLVAEDPDGSAWEFLDLDKPDPTAAAGTATALGRLYGAFRETGAGGVHDFNLLLQYTSGSTSEIKQRFSCRLLIQSLQNITINVGELPPVVRSKAYKVKITADGGRKPYTWTRSNDSNLPPGLGFDPKTAVLSGSVSDQGLSNQTFTLAVTATSAEGGPTQQPAEKAFNLRIVEPEQVAGYIASWIELGLAMVGIFGLGSFFYEVYKDHRERSVDLGKDLNKYLSSGDWKFDVAGHTFFDATSAREFADAVRKAVAENRLIFDGQVLDLKKTIQTLKEVEHGYDVREAARQTAKTTAQNVLRDAQASDAAKAAATAEITRLDAESAAEAKEKQRVEESRTELEKKHAEEFAKHRADGRVK